MSLKLVTNGLLDFPQTLDWHPFLCGVFVQNFGDLTHMSFEGGVLLWGHHG